MGPGARELPAPGAPGNGQIGSLPAGLPLFVLARLSWWRELHADPSTPTNAFTHIELSSRETEDLISIAREAIGNAVRRGQPTKIVADLRQSESNTALTVQDNGMGFDAHAVGRGLGTVTMQTRPQRLGAEITVLSIPGIGTTVRTTLPRSTGE